MSFEFTLLDALQALRCPVLDALAVFFDQAGAHGEIWIAFTAVLLAAVALPLRSGCRTAGSASRHLRWPGSSASRGCTCMCISPPTFWAAWHWALHWGPAAPCWQIRSATNGRNPVK